MNTLASSFESVVTGPSHGCCFQLSKKSVQTKGDSRGIPLAICFTTAATVGFTVMSWYTDKRSRTYSGNSSPDKEFRYLRTVRVTAAVYWTFDSELLPYKCYLQHYRRAVTLPL